MTLNNRQSLLIGLGIGLLIAVLAAGAVTIINRASHKHAAAVATPEGGKGSAMRDKSEHATVSANEPGSAVKLTEDNQKAAGVQISEVRNQRLTTEISAF